MKQVSWLRIAGWLVKIAWALFLVTLPVTSFPYFPSGFGGGTLVRPLAIYPMLILLPLAIIPRLLTKPLPKTIIPLLVFVLAALASSLLALLRGIEPALGITVTDRILRALITLAVGCAFYLTVTLYPCTLADLRNSLRWLYLGFGVALTWGSLQAIYVIHYMPSWFRVMQKLQRLVSTRKLIHNRVSGMTYEPNWFAEQICLMLLPWLLASVLHNSTVFRWRWRRVTIEAILLAWSVLLIPFTFSRAGVFNLVLLAMVGLLFFRPRPDQALATTAPKPKQLFRRLFEAGIALMLVAALIFAAGSRNEFFARLWDYWKKKETSIAGYFEYLGFGARFSYGEAAYNTYDAYPVFGVGLGNYAFYFEEMLPDEPLATTPEVLRLITPEEGRNRLITAKNFYLRLMAETGLVGLATFAAFVIAIFSCALYLQLSPYPKHHFWGTASILGTIGFFFAALSFDSFALPNMWILFGLITSAAWIFQQAPQPAQGDLSLAFAPATETFTGEN